MDWGEDPDQAFPTLRGITRESVLSGSRTKGSSGATPNARDLEEGFLTKEQENGRAQADCDETVAQEISSIPQ